MQATEDLMREHRLIERMLDSLEAAAARVKAGESMRVGFFMEAADFIKDFADGCHHHKEEGVLFPALEAAGVPRIGGPIGAMLAEHERGRLLTYEMRSAAERIRAGEPAAEDKLWLSAQGYVDLLRPHILKEDTVLFPMADRVIPGEQQRVLAEAFERIEREEIGEGVHEKYLGAAAALEREIGRQ